MPVSEVADDKSHLYLWIPNALLPEGLEVMKAWGFEYKTNIIWEKVRKDGMPDGRGVGFYFRNVTEMLLFGIRGNNNRTLDAGRSQVNLIRSIKREHSRKPDEFIPLIEHCSSAPFLELFARGNRDGWDVWGNQATEDYEPTWNTYANHTVAIKINNRMDISVELSGLRLDNPVVPASGTFGYGNEYKDFYDINILGSFSFKGTTREARFGNPTPRIAECTAGMINAVGLQNPGIDAVIGEELPRLKTFFRKPVIANISGFRSRSMPIAASGSTRRNRSV